MYKISDFTKPVYKTGEIMEILNISYSTIKVRPAGCIQRGPAELSGQ